MEHNSRNSELLERMVAERTAEFEALTQQLQHEIAERQLVEAALRASQGELRTLFNMVPDWILKLDRESRILFVNRPFPGTTREQMVGSRFLDRLPAVYRSRFEEAVGYVLASGQSSTIETVEEGKEGKSVWYMNRLGPVREESKTTAVILVRTEITALKETQEALRESEEKNRAILEATVDAIITINEQGRIESFNEAAERIFGYATADVVGRNVSMLMPSPYTDEHDSYLSNYLETGERKIIGIGRQVVARRKDGKVFPIELAVGEVHIGGRRLFTGIVRDISRRRRLEKDVLEISEEERRRIGQDLHDGLGGHLTGLGLISAMLARKLKALGSPEAADAEEITDLIHSADQQARNLARGLVPVDLEAHGLSAALGRLAVNVERLFRITCVFVEHDTVLVHDNAMATHLYRVAQEAVSNAVKHGQAGHVRIELARSGDTLTLKVTDDGIGFPDVLPAERGMGVRTMYYRANLIGARLAFTRPEEGGTIVYCALDLKTVRRTRPITPPAVASDEMPADPYDVIPAVQPDEAPDS